MKETNTGADEGATAGGNHSKNITKFVIRDFQNGRNLSFDIDVKSTFADLKKLNSK